MPLISIASGGGAGVAPVPRTDPHFASVVLLTHMDADPPIDEANSAHTITVAGGSIQSGKVKFGAAAFDAENSSSGRLTVPDHADFDFGSGQFTIEGWVNWNTGGPSVSDALLSQWNGGALQRSWLIEFRSTQKMEFSYSTNGTNITSIGTDSFTPVVGTWYHMAVDRDGNDDLRVYIDGTVRGSSNIGSATFHDSTALFSIGVPDSGSDTLRGVVDEVRITKGVARYGGAFTRPSLPFPDF